MSPNIPRCTVIINFIDNSRDCQNCHVVSNSGSPDFNNILEHADVTHRPCVKKIADAVTTYRDHYCGRKGPPQTQKIILPYPGIQLSDEKLSTTTTYSEHFRPYSCQKQQDSRGKIIVRKPSIVYEKELFEGKSETKSAYRYLDVEHKPVKSRGRASSSKQTGKDNQPFLTTTTYSSEFKVPKAHRRTAVYTPKPNISVSKEPFKYVSQYKSEYKYPKVKKDLLSESRKRRPSYKSPTVPMDKKTTYSSSFSLKTAPKPPPRHRRHPDLRCKECKMHREKKRVVLETHRYDEVALERETGDGHKEDPDPAAAAGGDVDRSMRGKNIPPAVVPYRPDIGDCCINSPDKM